MRTTVGVLVCVVAALGARGAEAAPARAATTPVERGRYLVSAMGCNDCHTPQEDDAAGTSAR